MPSRTSTRLVGPLALAALAACSSAAPPSSALVRSSGGAATAVATFEGRFDPATGTLTIRTTPTGPGVVGRVAYQPFQDGTPGTGPDETFELVTDAVPAPGFTASGCGGVGSFDGQITLRSFFRARSFSNVAVELTGVSTGHEACNGVAAYGGMSAGFGLWDYGSIGVKGSASAPLDHASAPWSFRFAVSEAFTFRGRIMAQADPIPAPANGATAFEWTPSMFTDPPHSFQDVATTLSHVVWDGVAFVDSKAVASFTRVGAAVPSTSVGIAYPALAHVGPWPVGGAGRYEASPTTLALDTSGDFTVCVKFKPGVNPGPMERKVLVAKGNPIGQPDLSYLAGDLGWALTQQHGPLVGGGPQYGFFYRTGNDTSATDSFLFPGTNPERSAFDYTCGGRASTGCVITDNPGYTGPCIRVMAHGRDVRFDTAVTGTFPGPETLPLVIGAAAGGLWPALDEGVYEVIIDSRPAALAVMSEIVDGAEGRRVYNGAAYLGNDLDALPVLGADGSSYGFPLGSTAPVSTDGSGLMTAGRVLRFAPVLPPGSTDSCVGAEVTSPDWSAALGGILGDDNGLIRIFIPTSDHVLTGFNGGSPVLGPDLRLQGWAAGSRHVFKVCAVAGGNVELWVDDALAASRATATGLFDLTSAANQLSVGQSRNDLNDLAPLTGARIGRVFACQTGAAGSCS